MYVLVSPCLLDPTLRAEGITKESDLRAFKAALERCRCFGIEVVPLPCPETAYLGRGRQPGTFVERLDTQAFATLQDRMRKDVLDMVQKRGTPLCIVGVDSSPCCGVNTTWYDEKRAGRGSFLARFPDIRAVDVLEFARYQIYLAAPLFSEAEQAFNRRLRDSLTGAFYDVYLPQEVGDAGTARACSAQQEIFRRHVKALGEVDAVVAVVDGADADSGTAWEMGYAYARGIPVIALRTDFRRAGHNEHVNLMLEESSSVVTAVEDVVPALEQTFRHP